MIKLILRLSFLVTALLISLFSEANGSVQCDVVLNEIDIDALPNLKMIMDDVISEKKDSTSMFYTVFLVRSCTDTTVYVTQETSHQLIDSDDYRGYFTIDKDTVIIRTPASKEIEVSRNSKESAFTISKNPPMTYHPDKWKYSICYDGFARYVNGIGWLWFSRTDDIHKGHKTLLTIPKRLLKNSRHVTENH